MFLIILNLLYLWVPVEEIKYFPVLTGLRSSRVLEIYGRDFGKSSTTYAELPEVLPAQDPGYVKDN